MFASIDISHPQVSIDRLRSALREVYGDEGIGGLPEIYANADGDSKSELEKNLICAVTPAAKISAYYFRHSDIGLEVHVDLSDGGHLFRACEKILKDLDRVFLTLTGVRPIGFRVPFTGRRPSLDSLDINMASGSWSGMSGRATSFWRELRSRSTIGMIGPALITVLGVVVVGLLLLGDDTNSRIVFGSISPGSLMIFGILSAIIAGRRTVRWIEP